MEQLYRDRSREMSGLATLAALKNTVVNGVVERGEATSTSRPPRGETMLQSFFQDSRYALRTFAKAPGFTLVAVLTLAVGIGANTAFFSDINGVLLQPPPYPDPDRMVLISNTYRGGSSLNSVPDYMDRVRGSSTLEAVAAISRNDTAFNLTGRGTSVHVSGANVTASFFDVTGVEPAL
jgi:putative ABC transport system permease protein